MSLNRVSKNQSRLSRRGQENDPGEGLRILARIIARAHLLNSQLETKNDNDNKKRAEAK